MKAQHTLQDSLEGFDFSKGQGMALLLCSYIPFFHLAVILGTLFVPWAGPGWRIGSAVTLLYLLPPFVARCIHALWPIREGILQMPSRDYFAWWSLLNLQVLFCRLPFLEELMRCVPGAYGVWLRLWGSKIGRFIYWAPGLQILDRSFLNIEDGVVFGAGVRLNPHVIVRNDSGKMELQLATIHLGKRAVIGGYALLTAGTRVAADESTKACLLSPPFSHWQDGRRVEKGRAPSEAEAIHEN